MAAPAIPDTRTVRRALLAWFRAHKRDLPWRRTRDPYAVLLSEVMLQQTRVETVIPYYQRFMQRFPTVDALAAADLDRVLELWSGLGYYRRARSLWHAAREVVARYGGEMPRARRELESLPGIGPYSAGAIASIAFGDEEALVDGNVARVLSRLHGIGARTGSRESVERCWALARELVRGDAPGDLNQALMELGATVCTPKSPRCEACPVSGECVALRDGRVEELPLPKERRASPKLSFDALVVQRGPRVLLAKRPPEGLFGGLWEPPMLAASGPRAAVSSPAWLEPLGAERSSGRSARVTHVLTHRVFDVRVVRYAARHAPRGITIPGYVEAVFDEPSGGKALSTLARKILEAEPVGRSTRAAGREIE